jgi:hypothetical protein
VRWCQDPARAGKFKQALTFKTSKELASLTLTTKLGKIDYLDGLDCPFSIRARFAKCGVREDTANYDPLMIVFCAVDVQSIDMDDLAIADGANEDQIMVSTPLTATEMYRIKTITAGRVGSLATLGDQPINDIEYCGSAACAGYCGKRTDSCTVIWGVTDTDTTPYAAPNLVYGLKNLVTGVITWTSYPVLGVNGNLENIECAGDRLLVSSNGFTSIGYNDDSGDPDEWNWVALAYAPSTNHNALFARTPTEIWCACASGRLYKSTDKGETWTASHAGTLTTQTLNAVWAYDANLIYAVGNNGAIIRSTNGGSSWTDLTEVATTAANLLAVKVPPGRENEVFIGTNDGQIFHSNDKGLTWTAYSFTGDGVGTVDDIDFCGPCGGDVMYILHNDSGPRGRVLRDLSGGYGGGDVEVVVTYTELVAAGIDLNAIACCNENTVIVAGENSGGYPMVALVN